MIKDYIAFTLIMLGFFGMICESASASKDAEHKVNKPRWFPAECIDVVDPKLINQGYELYAAVYVSDTYDLVDTRYINYYQPQQLKIHGHMHYMLKKRVD